MGLKPSALIDPLAEATRLSKRVGSKVVHESATLDVPRTLIRDAKGSGLGREVRGVESAVDEVAEESKSFERIERALAAERPGLHALADVVAAASPARTTTLERLIGHFSQRDRVDIVVEAMKMARGLKAYNSGHVNKLAGSLRELVAKWLPEIVTEVDATKAALREAARGSSVLAPVDSAVHGAVQLPTRLRGGERSIRLGTDRLVGMGQIEPQRVAVAWSDGSKGLVDLAGELDVRLAMEIKGRTNAVGGVGQLALLRQRGTRGYAQIGGQLWLMKYRPAGVTHLLVAPPGKALDEARLAAKELTRTGTLTKIVQIPKDLDDEVRALAECYLAAAMSLL